MNTNHSLGVALALLSATLLLAPGQAAQKDFSGVDIPDPVGPFYLQQPGDPNPTGTPIGEAPALQPIDTPQTVMLARGPLTSDRAQAAALLAVMEEHPGAPRWVICSTEGDFKLDLDDTTNILKITEFDEPELAWLPGIDGENNLLLVSNPWDDRTGETLRYDGIDLYDVQMVANGVRSWSN